MGVKVNGRHGRLGQDTLKGNLTALYIYPVFFCFNPNKECFSGKVNRAFGILLRHVSLDCLCSVAALALVLCVRAGGFRLFRPLGVQLFSRGQRLE